jgi:hypothetical protein
MHHISSRVMIRSGITSLTLGVIMTTSARAGDEGSCYWVSRDPAVGYTLPIQRVFQFPAAFVYQPTLAEGYAVPIQHVRQFPAAFVSQPGAEVPWGGVLHSAYDQYGPSFIPR